MPVTTEPGIEKLRNTLMPDETRCRFEKALISQMADCPRAKQFMVGERLGFKCLSPPAAQRCERYLSHLRKNSNFVFRQPRRANSPLSNRQEICLQCGGLLGLAATLDEPAAKIELNIYSLLDKVESRYSEMESINLERVIPHIASYEPRPHRKKRNR